MTSHRRLMDPSTLEAILMLRFNHHMWDIYLLDSIVAKVQASADAEEEQEDLADEEEHADFAWIEL